MLDQIRGIVRPLGGKGEVVEFQQARTVDQAEKGVILGEILELENQVAQVQLDLESAASTHKGRIKSLQADIRDLKNAAACNQRVLTVKAYKKTDWETGKVYTLAIDDDRELAVEDLPKGAQRSIPGTDGEAKAETPAIAGAVEKFVGAMEAKGFKVSGDKDENGVPRITATETDEPGPLADEETVKAHASKKVRKSKGEARA